MDRQSLPTVAVVGGGPAGMMAAYSAACALENLWLADCVQIVLYERNPMLGKKLRITGKGRCNVTNNCTPQEFMASLTRNQKFLYGAAARFPAAKTMSFFENYGVPLKTERGRRVFPVSDKAADIVAAMERALEEKQVRICRGCRITAIQPEKDGYSLCMEDTRHTCSALILATGGVSYPGTGSTGDGHRMLSRLHVPITPLKPSLVPMETKENVSALMGLTLKNVALSVHLGDKEIFREQGEMLFAHFGLTGPLVLSASANMQSAAISDYRLTIDLKPALSPEELDRRLLGDFAKYSARDFCNALDDLLPKKLIPWVIGVSGIPEHCKVSAITRQMRQSLVQTLKALPFSPKSFRPMSEAIVTCGGVQVSALSPKDMMLKTCPGLFCAGELLDLDAYTGGYNLQIAFSTGFLAGEGAASYIEKRFFGNTTV